jgi:hypothetical protein
MEWEEVPPAKAGTNSKDKADKEDDGVTKMRLDHKAEDSNNEGSKPAAIKETPMITDGCNDDMSIAIETPSKGEAMTNFGQSLQLTNPCAPEEHKQLKQPHTCHSLPGRMSRMSGCFGRVGRQD